jgi:hypothetical protein
MAHPGDDSGLGSLFKRNPPCPGNRAAADRGGMDSNGLSEPLSQCSMGGVEGQEFQNGLTEVLDVICLRLFTPASIGSLAFGMSCGRSLCLQFGANPIDRRYWSEDSS